MKHARRMMVLGAVVAALTLLGPALRAPAQPTTKPVPKPPAARRVQRQMMIDHGPFVTATITSQWFDGQIINKAIAVRLASGSHEQHEVGGVLFDTDTLRVSAGWVGGFIDFTKDWTSVRDARSVKLIGTQTFGTRTGPGWADPAAAPGGADEFKDPRDNGWGPLPRAWVKYKGLYLHGDQVILSYSVGACEVLESPGLEEVAETPAEPAHPGQHGHQEQYVLTRTIELGKSDRPLKLLVCEREGAAASIVPASAGAPGEMAALDVKGGDNGSTMRVGIAAMPKGAAWRVSEAGDAGRVVLEVPAEATPCQFKLLIWERPERPAAAKGKTPPQLTTEAMARVLAATPPPADLRALTRGGPSHWDQAVTTTGTLGAPRGKDDAYVVDTLTLPDDNPWHAWMRPGGFDFFSDPTRAAVCNWSGDVWVVSGIDEKLQNLKWRRIATGLFQPLGLKIVKDEIYVLGRDQVTRLRDLNGDGEADFYENFNNDVQVTSNFHEFAFDLQTDPQGNFFFSKAGPVRNGGHGFEAVAAHHGSVLKLSPDGQKLDVYATGFRAPNGVGIGPGGQVTTGDNEGSWVPMCRINWVKPGGFYGVVPTAHRTPPPTSYDGPLCWMPKEVDNSSGGQVWVTSDRWGPFAGRLLHLSYGQCSLFLVLKEEVAGQVQGGVVKFPLSFDSGIMRARFNPGDGQLYVAGLKGWQTTAGKDGCFQRVRYTGKPVNMPCELHVSKEGLKITFTCALDPEEAKDAGNYGVERWNYLWSENYGSPHLSVADPSKHVHDPMEVKSARLLPDGKTVFLEVPDLKPVMQMKTEINLKAADGSPIRYEIYHTVHAL